MKLFGIDISDEALEKCSKYNIMDELLKRQAVEVKSDKPENLEPVLAKIQHQNSLGLSEWYEVVYFDDKWCSYSGSKTFKDGEQVVSWKYCKDCL